MQDKNEKECKAWGPSCFHDADDDVMLVRVEVHERPLWLGQLHEGKLEITLLVCSWLV